MIRYKLKELVARKELETRRRLTLEEISSQTGVHRSTLSRINNQKAPTLKMDVVDKLCTYFDIPVSELIEHVKER